MTSALIARMLVATHDERSAVYAGLSYPERQALSSALAYELDNPWRRFEADPVGFVTHGLGETLWSKQAEILTSIRDNKRTAVPACHAPGKSHIAARAVAWWVCVHPPSTVQVVTTASQFRQIRNVLFPHIRRVVDRHKLPGHVYTVDWKIENEIVAFGFSAQNHDESAVQGIHAPHLLVVVDEAGGLNEIMGTALEALMTGAHTRMLVLGNPPTDSETSWFERACRSPLYNVIPIDAFSTPNFTGEDAGICRACPHEVPTHSVAEHLVDEEWVTDVIREYGDDSPFVQARVYARFPRSLVNKVVPITWLEEGVLNSEPAESSVIRLGIDVASDGGDEFVIAEADGFRGKVLYRKSGSENQNAVDVAGKVMEAIHAAEHTHLLRNVKEQVVVKIDSIGVGWGVVSLLQRWGDEGKHQSEIVGVNVGERASQPHRFANQRAEMWWNMRSLLQPDPNTGKQEIAFPNASQALVAQLSSPTYRTDSTGRVQIERKADMKKRGLSSPDQAEAMLLAFYEPPGRRKSEAVAPIAMSQRNPWLIK